MTGYEMVSLLLVVLGWALSGRYAIKQINLAHEKNRELQYEVLRHSLRNELYKEFIKIYLDICGAIEELASPMRGACDNMLFELESEGRDSYKWREFLDSTLNKYQNLYLNMNLLRFWLETATDYIPNQSEISDTIILFENHFTKINHQELKNPIDKEALMANRCWFDSEKAKAAIIFDGLTPQSYTSYEESSKRVSKFLGYLREKLTSEAQIIRKHLHSPGTTKRPDAGSGL